MLCERGLCEGRIQAGEKSLGIREVYLDSISVSGHNQDVYTYLSKGDSYEKSSVRFGGSLGLLNDWRL